MIEAVFPSSIERCARRIGFLCLVLAACVWKLFPTAADIGTAVEADRTLLAIALGTAGLAVRLQSKRLLVVLPALAALIGIGFLLQANWVNAFAVAGIVYVLVGLRPGPEAPAEGEELQIPPVEVVRENVEAIAMALVLALVVREFAFEAFKIPTASMEPTILGNEGRRKGDRLLANKWRLNFDDPPRWSIVVFRLPLFRPVNYIKRLVGLPGELIELRDGDVYVDGVIAAKPDRIQRQMWFPVYPTAPSSATELGTVFLAKDGDWKFGTDTATITAPPGDPAWLDYDDFITCADARVDATFDVAKLGLAGRLHLVVEGGGRRAVLDVGADGVYLTAPGHPRAALDVSVPVLEGARTQIGFSVADRVARVYLGGRQVARVPYEDVSADGPNEAVVAIGASDVQLTVSDVVVRRDISYSQPAGENSWQVPDDSFFMLGDNTDNSRDSRLWAANVITTNDGQEFIADNDIRDDAGVARRNLQFKNGVLRFVDSYGIPRMFPRDKVEVQSGVRKPFVHRDDLLGRAFLTFFPFPPFGEFRPRFLP